MVGENKHHRLAIGVLAGLVLIIAFLVYRTPQAILIGSVPLIGQSNAKIGLPMRFKIPSIGVDTVIEQVGVAPDGNMDVPKGPNDVAWFKFGPRPGEIGSAVIAGHYGWKNNTPSAFDKVSTLQKGDKVFVEDDTGATITFVVRETRLFDPKADASSVFNSNDGKVHLNLITCEGVWNATSKSYPKRLVVFTDRVDSTISP